jgi:hypothetical protein
VEQWAESSDVYLFRRLPSPRLPLWGFAKVSRSSRWNLEGLPGWMVLLTSEHEGHLMAFDSAGEVPASVSVGLCLLDGLLHSTTFDMLRLPVCIPPFQGPKR